MIALRFVCIKAVFSYVDFSPSDGFFVTAVQPSSNLSTVDTSVYVLLTAVDVAQLRTTGGFLGIRPASSSWNRISSVIAVFESCSSSRSLLLTSRFVVIMILQIFNSV